MRLMSLPIRRTRPTWQPSSTGVARMATPAFPSAAVRASPAGSGAPTATHFQASSLLIAVGKAYGALAIGFGSRWLEKASADRPHFVAGLNAVSGGNIVPVPGGVLVRDSDKRLIGAVGVTGDTSDNDEAAALAAIIRIGMTPQAD